MINAFSLFQDPANLTKLAARFLISERSRGDTRSAASISLPLAAPFLPALTFTLRSRFAEFDSAAVVTSPGQSLALSQTLRLFGATDLVSSFLFPSVWVGNSVGNSDAVGNSDVDELKPQQYPLSGEIP